MTACTELAEATRLMRAEDWAGVVSYVDAIEPQLIGKSATVLMALAACRRAAKARLVCAA